MTTPAKPAPKPTPHLKPSQRLRSRVRSVPKDIRQQVFERDGWTCRWCGMAGGGLDSHHRRRRSQGGKDTLENLVSVHRSCHRAIHERPLEARARGFLLFTEDVR